MAGGMNAAKPSTGYPPISSRAPAATARSTWPFKRPSASFEDSGASVVAGSIGSPILSSPNAAFYCSRKWSASGSTTMKRFDATQL
jgi:hypothetical protein